MWNHWVVRASTPYQPFNDFEVSRKAWISLVRSFPQTLAGVIMPNHWHLILPAEMKEKSVFSKLGSIMGNVSKDLKIQGLWQPIPPPALVPDRFHLKRQIRYIALNPCRKSLCRDPLEWYWSTYRDLFGASIHPPRPGALAKILGESQTHFLVRFHAYVTGDPTVSVSGTPPPSMDTPQYLAYKSLDEILAAAAATLRVQASAIRKEGPLRPLFIHLAYEHGWRKRTSLLAEICGTSSRAIRFVLKQPPPQGIAAAKLCLSDDRLRLKRVFPFDATAKRK